MARKRKRCAVCGYPAVREAFIPIRGPPQGPWCGGGDCADVLEAKAWRQAGGMLGLGIL